MLLFSRGRPPNFILALLLRSQPCLVLFQLGDEILEGNGRAFPRLTHDEAVRILKCSQSFDLVVRHIGKVPHSSSMAGSDTCDLVNFLVNIFLLIGES